MSDSHCTAGSPDPSFGSQGMPHKEGGYCSDATTPAAAQRPRKRMRVAGEFHPTRITLLDDVSALVAAQLPFRDARSLRITNKACRSGVNAGLVIPLTKTLPLSPDVFSWFVASDLGLAYSSCSFTLQFAPVVNWERQVDMQLTYLLNHILDMGARTLTRLQLSSTGHGYNLPPPALQHLRQLLAAAPITVLALERLWLDAGTMAALLDGISCNSSGSGADASSMAAGGGPFGGFTATPVPKSSSKKQAAGAATHQHAAAAAVGGSTWASSSSTSYSGGDAAGAVPAGRHLAQQRRHYGSTSSTRAPPGMALLLEGCRVSVAAARAFVAWSCGPQRRVEALTLGSTQLLGVGAVADALRPWEAWGPQAPLHQQQGQGQVQGQQQGVGLEYLLLQQQPAVQVAPAAQEVLEGTAQEPRGTAAIAAAQAAAAAAVAPEDKPPAADAGGGDVAAAEAAGAVTGAGGDGSELPAGAEGGATDLPPGGFMAALAEAIAAGEDSVEGVEGPGAASALVAAPAAAPPAAPGGWGLVEVPVDAAMAAALAVIEAVPVVPAAGGGAGNVPPAGAAPAAAGGVGQQQQAPAGAWVAVPAEQEVLGLHQLPSSFGAGLTSLQRLSLTQLLLPRLASLPGACLTQLEIRGCTTLLDEGLSWPGSVVELSVTDVRPPEGHPTLQPFSSLAQLPKLTRLVLDGTLLDAKAVPLYCLPQLSSLSMRSCGLVYTELGGLVQGSISAMTQHPDPEQQGGVLRELVALNLSNKEYSVGQPTEQLNRLRGVDLQALSGLSRLTSLDISYSSLQDRMIVYSEAFPLSLRGLTLQGLMFSTDYMLGAYAMVLMKSLPHLELLDMRAARYGNEPYPEAIMYATAHGVRLLSGPVVEPEPAAALAAAAPPPPPPPAPPAAAAAPVVVAAPAAEPPAVGAAAMAAALAVMQEAVLGVVSDEEEDSEEVEAEEEAEEEEEQASGASSSEEEGEWQQEEEEGEEEEEGDQPAGAGAGAGGGGGGEEGPGAEAGLAAAQEQGEVAAQQPVQAVGGAGGAEDVVMEEAG